MLFVVSELVLLGIIVLSNFFSYLKKKNRGVGVDQKLIDATEKFALEKGFNFVLTETLSFQARPFYEKNGHKIFGELPDYPKK